MKPPAHQYKHGDIFILAAREDEPKLLDWSAGKASKYLDEGALAWERQRQCIACHTNGAYVMLRPALTPYLGPPLAEVKAPFNLGPNEPKAQARQPGTTSVIPHLQVACALAEWDAHVTKQLSQETDYALLLLCNMVSDEGALPVLNQRWVPYILSSYHNVCMLVKAIGTAPGWLEKVRSEKNEQALAAVERMRKYLQTAQPQNDYDLVYLLWADLRWPGLLDSQRRQEIVQMIGRQQRGDGGWSLRSFGTPETWGNGNRKTKLRTEGYGEELPSDGHMTGLAIIILREAGVPVEDARIQQGVAWLKANQRESGRWWTRSLNTDYWQFSTYHGTAHALLAAC